MSWWTWVLFGLVLLGLELLSPGGFYLFFFGIGALAVGLLASLGIAGAPWLEWLLFGALSIAALLWFRKPLQERTRNRLDDREVDSLVGSVAIPLENIEVQQVGKVEMRGTAWTARNVGDRRACTGQRCRVERVEGLMLHIRG